MTLKYPIWLLPNFFWHHIDINFLKGDFYLTRRSVGNQNTPFDTMGFLVISSFLEKEKEFAGLSLNLLGGMFQESHVIYRPVKYAMQDWKTLSFVNIYKVYMNIEVLENVHPISLRLDLFHDITFPYERNDKDYKKRIPAELISNHEPKVHMRIEHKPVMANFWHAQLEIRDTYDSSKLNLTTKYGKDICNHLICHVLASVRKAEGYTPSKIRNDLYSYNLWSVIKKLLLPIFKKYDPKNS